MTDNTEQNKNCCVVHPMYDTLLCENPEGHDGLHKAEYQGEWLRWGIPSQKERYDVVRTK
jgi:hypothetical protein